MNLPHFAHPARLFLVCRLMGPSFILSWVCTLVLQIKQAAEDEAPGRQCASISSFSPSGGLYVAFRADHALRLSCSQGASWGNSHEKVWTSGRAQCRWCHNLLRAPFLGMQLHLKKSKEKLLPKFAVWRHMQAVISLGFLEALHRLDLGFAGRDWEQIVFIQSVYLVSETTPTMWSRCGHQQRGGRTEDKTRVLESWIDKQVE